MSDKKFQFHVPIELVKGESEDTWKIRGIASTGDQDLQGEEVSQEGLDITALKAGRGLFNWDHQKGPENVLGQIEEAEFITHDGKKALQVEGYLFKHQDRAKAFHNILKSIKKGNGPRVHMSIEGKIMERDFQDSQKIKKARIDKVALTLDPVNPYTYAQLCKSLASPDSTEKSLFNNIDGEALVASEEYQPTKRENAQDLRWMLKDIQELKDIKWLVENDVPEAKEILEKEYSRLKREISKKIKEHASLKKSEEDAAKALAAGTGHANAPGTRTGGEAMQQESLERDPTDVSYSKKKTNKNKKMIKSILEGLVKTHPEHDPLELASWVVEAFTSKLKGES